MGLFVKMVRVFVKLVGLSVRMVSEVVKWVGLIVMGMVSFYDLRV